MFCNKCGKSTSNGKICASCGNNLVSEVIEKNEVVETIEEDKPDKIPKKRLIIISIVIVISLLFIVIMIYVNTQKKEEKTLENKESKENAKNNNNSINNSVNTQTILGNLSIYIPQGWSSSDANNDEYSFWYDTDSSDFITAQKFNALFDSSEEAASEIQKYMSSCTTPTTKTIKGKKWSTFTCGEQNSKLYYYMYVTNDVEYEITVSTNDTSLISKIEESITVK